MPTATPCLRGIGVPETCALKESATGARCRRRCAGEGQASSPFWMDLCGSMSSPLSMNQPLLASRCSSVSSGALQATSCTEMIVIPQRMIASRARSAPTRSKQPISQGASWWQHRKLSCSTRRILPHSVCSARRGSCVQEATASRSSGALGAETTCYARWPHVTKAPARLVIASTFHLKVVTEHWHQLRLSAGQGVAFARLFASVRSERVAMAGTVPMAGRGQCVACASLATSTQPWNVYRVHRCLPYPGSPSSLWASLSSCLSGP
mmetsp:Transcript_6968/g.17307  ORF Transcript_6968/g.17307 Transcript_6968/m.17307 type:complete len:266 (+) Transcript_6968:120-917(+)